MCLFSLGFPIYLFKNYPLQKLRSKYATDAIHPNQIFTQVAASYLLKIIKRQILGEMGKVN